MNSCHILGSDYMGHCVDFWEKTYIAFSSYLIRVYHKNVAKALLNLGIVWQYTGSDHDTHTHLRAVWDSTDCM